MCQWIGSALVQIMACRLFGAKPLYKPTLGYCQLDPWGQTSVNFNQNIQFSIHEIVSEHIACEMAAILSRWRWVNGAFTCFKFNQSMTPEKDIWHQLLNVNKHLSIIFVSLQLWTIVYNVSHSFAIFWNVFWFNRQLLKIKFSYDPKDLKLCKFT